MVKFSWLTGLFFSAALLLTSHASSEPAIYPGECPDSGFALITRDPRGEFLISYCVSPSIVLGTIPHRNLPKKWLLSAQTVAVAPSIAWNSSEVTGTIRLKRNGKIVTNNFTTTLFHGETGDFTNYTLEKELSIGRFLGFDSRKGIMIMAIRIPETNFIDVINFFAKVDKQGNILEMVGISIDSSDKNRSPIKYLLIPDLESKSRKGFKQCF